MSNGYDYEMFLVKPSELYSCAVCHNVFNDPHQCCKNNHEFCLMCIMSCIKNRNGCPSCRAHIDITKLSKSRVLGEIIGAMTVKCNFETALSDSCDLSDCCNWTGSLDALKIHTKTCIYNKCIDCPIYHLGHCMKGCNGTLLRKNILQHFETYFQEYKKTAEIQLLHESILNKQYIFSINSDNIFDGFVDLDSDLRNGHGTLTYKKFGSKFTGFCVNNLKQGFGIFSGGKWCYNGEWLNDTMHGYCNLETMQNSRYTGEYKNNRRNGRGTAVYPDKSVFVGEWSDGKRCGRGTLTKANGSFYIGSFFNDIQQGVGVETREYGVTFEGFFSNGIFQGPGKLIVNDEYTYEGEFENEKPHGCGLWTELETMMVYEGSFVHGHFHGKGIKTMKNGKSFDGQFEKDNFRIGIMREVDGTVFTGQFINDVIVGIGTKVIPNKSRYQGQFLNGVINGEGTLTKNDGEIYEGVFVHGMLQGEGKWSSELFEYVGEFDKNLPHGNGSLRNCECFWTRTKSNSIGLVIKNLTGEFPNALMNPLRLNYTGSFHSGWLHGFGKLFYGNRFLYEGKFDRNTFQSCCFDNRKINDKKICLIDLSEF